MISKCPHGQCPVQTSDLPTHISKYHPRYVAVRYPDRSNPSNNTLYWRACGPSYPHSDPTKSNLVKCRGCGDPKSVQSIGDHSRKCIGPLPSISDEDRKQLKAHQEPLMPATPSTSTLPIPSHTSAAIVQPVLPLPLPLSLEPAPSIRVTSAADMLCDQASDNHAQFMSVDEPICESAPNEHALWYDDLINSDDIFVDTLLKLCHYVINTVARILICTDCRHAVPLSEVPIHAKSHHSIKHSKADLKLMCTEDFKALYGDRISRAHWDGRSTIDPLCRECVPVLGLRVISGYSCAMDARCTYAAPLPDTVQKHHYQKHRPGPYNDPTPAPRIQSFYDESYQRWFTVADMTHVTATNVGLVKYYREVVRQKNAIIKTPGLVERHPFYSQPDFRWPEFVEANYKHQLSGAIRNLAHGEKDNPSDKSAMERLRALCLVFVTRLDSSASRASSILRQHVQSKVR
jgi:hypothetical protein